MSDEYIIKCKAIVNQLLDVVTTSGIDVKVKAEIEELKLIKSILNPGKKFALASGVAIDNVKPCLSICDYFIVASSVETYSKSGILVAQKVSELADMIHNGSAK